MLTFLAENLREKLVVHGFTASVGNQLDNSANMHNSCTIFTLLMLSSVKELYYNY